MKYQILIWLLTCLFGRIWSLDNGVGLLPPMGWNSWCTDDWIECETDFCNEKEIKEMADAMASNGMKDVGYQYINLDDCWAGPRDSNGNLTPDPDRFPSGMKPLVNYIHSKGLLFGLYTCAGNYTCKGYRPGSWGHFDQDAETFASWDVDYVKMDWCYHPPLSPQVVYPMMRDSLNKTGRPIFFNLCEWGEGDPWTWANSVGNSWRIGPDHLPFWWLPYTNQGTGDIIESMVGLSKFSGPGGWNDPDFLMTGALTVTYVESKTEFSFWSLWAAPLIVTTDIRDMSNKAEILLNDEIIAVNQDKLTIAGDRISSSNDGGQVWAKPLSNGQFAVILYNKNDLFSTTVTVYFKQLWPESGNITCQVRDLWKHEDQGEFLNYYSARVIGHGVVMITLKKRD